MLTPMMKQYLKIKEQYKDCLIFYRLGDFYEMFFGDAKIGSEVLGLTLTGRDCGSEERAPMCGVPYHSCDSYIAKLVANGYKVAICEQLTDPKESKGIVERGITRIVTPGTITIPDAYEETKNNFLMCIVKIGSSYAIAVTDVSTGELHATEFKNESAKTDLLSEAVKYNPSEVVCNKAFFEDKFCREFLKSKVKPFIQCFETDAQDKENAMQIVISHFEGKYPKYLLKEKELSVSAIAVLLRYLNKMQMTDLKHICNIDFYENTQYLSLDTVARQNLELVKTMRDGNKKGSLYGVLDKTKTSMGARLLANWINQPLVSVGHIKRRLDAVEELIQNVSLRDALRECLKDINDIERLVSKLEYSTVNARDLNALKDSAKLFPEFERLILNAKSGLMVELSTEFDLLADISMLIETAIKQEDVPFTIREGGIIRKGYDAQLDEWIDARDNGGNRLRELEARERERTGIKNLKIAYNRVFGYYIEVTRSYYDFIPDNYIRKQTLANAERFITEELKELEDLVLRSNEKIVAREYNIFCQIRDKIKTQLERIQKSAKVLSTVDVLCNFATVSVKNNYVKPEISLDDEIEIKDGRHPVVETFLTDSLFVPNDAFLDCDENMTAIITGPNMAGKSTYMRQIAIIVIMAQMGCFVPASYAKIGIVDKIFTRIGASDDLSSGQSTFMVEMSEVANILDNATPKSLLLLDEIGRGTSTFDGMSIAWAIIEYVSDKKKLGARTLFATHYHELTQLEDKIKGVKNYCIVAKKRDDNIVFLRKIVRGGADESFGVEVAKLAGVKDEVIKRGKQILSEIEKGEVKKPKTQKTVSEEENMQFDIVDNVVSDFLEEIKRIDINVLSPIEAMNKLFEIKNKADKL